MKIKQLVKFALFVIPMFVIIIPNIKSQCIVDVMRPVVGFLESGGSKGVGIEKATSSCTFTAHTSATWLNLIVFSDWVTIECEPNTGYERSATITFDGSSKIITVTQFGLCQKPAAAGAISGLGSLCGGSSTTYYISPISRAITYKWSIDNGTIVGNGTSASVTGGIGSTATITVYGENSCGQGISSSKTITLKKLPAVPKPLDSESTCGPKTLSIGAISENETDVIHKWYLYSSGGTELPEDNINSGVMGQNYFSNYEKYFTTTTTMYVAAQNSCGTTSRIPVKASISRVDVPDITISALGEPSAFCPLDQKFILSTISGSHYQWKKNGMDIPNATNRTFRPSESNHYSVEVTTISCGNKVVESPQLYVNILPIKSLTISINNPFPLCQGNFAIFTASVSDNLGTFVDYQWYVDDIPKGENSSTFRISSLNGGSKIRCTVNLHGGACAQPSFATSNEVTAQFISLPTLPRAIENISTCGSKTFSIGAVSENEMDVIHKWYLYPSGGTELSEDDITSGIMGQNYFSNYEKYFTTTTIMYVAAKNSCGMTSRVPVKATVNSNDLPNVTVSSFGEPSAICPTDERHILTTIKGSSYHWRINGVPITGARDRTYRPTESGIYSVEVGTLSCGNRIITSDDLEITMAVPPTIRVNAEPSFTTDLGVSIKLKAIGASTYEWLPNEFFSPSLGNIVDCMPLESATFYIEGADENGCKNTKSFDVTVNFGVGFRIAENQLIAFGKGGRSPYAYKWHNDAANASIPLPGVGTVCTVEVTDADGQKATRSITIPFQNLEPMNYIFTRKPREKMQTIPDNYTFGNITGSVQYFDELGRPLQTVAIEGSPDKLSLIQPIDYDNTGREKFKYLPYVAVDGWGLYRDKTEWVDAQKGFYDNLLPTLADGQKQGQYAKAETDFEESPLNRVLRQGGVGQQWQLGEGHEKQIDYQTNGGDVIKWEVTGDALNKGLISRASANEGFYHANTLTILKATDENGHWSRVYKDITGKVVLKESMPMEGQGAAPLRNYYVYDDLGNLRCVIPPEAEAVGYNSDEFDEFCYYYKYDNRNRLIEKKIPGAGTVYMVYDKRDRPVLTQDGNMRNKTPKQWMVTKYENNFNRPVITGILEDDRDRTTLQTDEFDNDLTFAFPAEADIEVLSRTYYDSYDNISFNLGNYGFVDAFSLNNRFNKLKGQVVASIIKVIETGEELRTVSYYDDKYRVIQTTGDNHMGGKDVVSNRYDFTGQLVETKQAHYKNDKTNVTNSIDKELSYDDAGRLQTVAMKLNTELALHTIAKYNYNPLGQLIEKKYHQLANESFLFSTTNTYNINGWLKNLNSNGGGKMLFDMNLFYEDGTYPKYNGNISRMTWNSSKLDGVKTYNYKYDELDRIREANYSSAGDDKYSTQYDYDKNGNIETLVRYGLMGSAGYGLIDNLVYTYNGNKLLGVNDGELPNQRAYGFRDNGIRKDPVATDISTHEYLYDANGNMKTDLNKEINRVEYNYLNLPDFILFKGNENAIEYQYDAAGQKVKQIVRGTSNKETDYCGNFVYENGSLKFILTDDGRLLPNGTGFTYEYFIKDHLGNVRTTLINNGGTLEVKQENHYYPFGMTLSGQTYSCPSQLYENKIKFQGQEEQDGYDLGWYNFKWRMHNPEIGRFMVVDPLTDKYPWNSPYAFSENVVINAVELEGLEKVNLMPPDDPIWYAAEANDNEEIIFVYAHSNDEFMRDRSPQGHLAIINSGKTLLKVLDREGISIKNKSIVVLHSCRSAPIAKEISSSQEFKDKLIIAPVERMHVDVVSYMDKNGNVVRVRTKANTYEPKRDKNGREVNDSEGHVIRSDKRANFEFYLNGKLIYRAQLPDFEYTYDNSKDPAPNGNSSKKNENP